MMDGDARWHCDFHIADLSYDEQMAGCKSHRYLPGLVPGVQYDSDSGKRTISYGLDDGTSWTDGGDDD